MADEFQKHEANEQNKEPYIRERIMPKRDWKHYLLIGAMCIVGAMVMGLSVGIGITIASPLLKQQLGATTVSTTEWTRPIETEQDTQETSQTTQEMTVTETSTEDLPPVDIEIDPDERAMIEAIVKQAIDRKPVTEDDIGAFSNAVKTLYAKTNMNFMAVTVLEDDPFAYEPKTIYALVVKTSGTYINLLAMSDQFSKAGSMYVTIGNHDYDVQITGKDELTGLLLLTADVSGADLKAIEAISEATFGSGSKLTAGDVLIAAGNPLGFAGSNGYGMVTGITDDYERIDMNCHIIHTDIDSNVDIQSSGYLFDLKGNVVGVIASSKSVYQLEAYMIDDFHAVIDRMESGYDISFIGITGQEISVEQADAYHMEAGVYVRSVIADTPAYLAGLQDGDIIVSYNGNKVLTMEDLEKELLNTEPGDKIVLGIRRFDRDQYAAMELSVQTAGRLKMW